MGASAFIDKQHRPVASEVRESMSSSYHLWEDLTHFIEDSYKAYSELKIYGKKLGWAVRFRQGSKALISLYPGKNSFTAQIIINQACFETASHLGLSENTKKALSEAHPYPEGRWVYMRIGSEKDLADVKRMITLKATSSKKP